MKQAGKAAHLSWMQMPDLASAGLWHRVGGKDPSFHHQLVPGLQRRNLSDVWSAENVDMIA